MPHALVRANLRWVLRMLLWLVAGGAIAQVPAGDDMRARFATAVEQSKGKMPDRPVYLLSTESGDRMQGDVYARVERPNEDLRPVLVRAEGWCDILFPHLNTQYIRCLGVTEQAVLP